MFDFMTALYKDPVWLLCTIPGVVVSEIRTDTIPLSNSKRLHHWADPTPGDNESASKKKAVRVMCAGIYFKSALVQTAYVLQPWNLINRLTISKNTCHHCYRPDNSCFNLPGAVHG